MINKEARSRVANGSAAASGKDGLPKNDRAKSRKQDYPFRASAPTITGKICDRYAKPP